MEPGYLQANIVGFFRGLSSLGNFGFRFIREVLKRPFEFKEFVKQSYYVGNKSLLLIAITAFIMGLVLTLQTRPELAKFGAESWLPAMVAVSIVKEIGPVITAVIFAGKTGSGIGAELASMRVTEQVDAMEASGVNPFKYVVVTRILATTLMLPLLVIFADAVGLYGSFFGINLKSSINLQLFISQVFQKLAFSDLFPAVVKTFLFGFAIGLVSCYIGYNINEGTAGVGKAANKAVVFGSLMVFIIDMIAVQVTILFT